MNDDAVTEHLVGAFLDEELAHQDVDKLLDLLECEDTRSRACRQALAGQLMSNPQAQCMDISASVRQAIAQEPPLQKVASAPPRRRRRLFARRGEPAASAAPHMRRGWQVPATGVALAASVAMAALVVFKPADTDSAAAPAEQLAQASTTDEPATNNVTRIAASDAQPAVTKTQPTARRSPSVAGRSASALKHSPAQLVAAGNRAAPHTGGRELVISSPQQSQPVSAQWSLVSEHNNRAQSQANQQRARQKLNTYLISHARQGGGSALPGALGYARVAARPAQRTGTE